MEMSRWGMEEKPKSWINKLKALFRSFRPRFYCYCGKGNVVINREVFEISEIDLIKEKFGPLIAMAVLKFSMVGREIWFEVEGHNVLVIDVEDE